MTLDHATIEDLFGRIGSLQKAVETLEERQRREREQSTADIRRDVSRVEEKVDKVNGTVRKHAECIAGQTKLLEIHAALITKLPCQADPQYIGAVMSAVNTSDKRWERLINIVQILVLSVATAKLAGLF